MPTKYAIQFHFLWIAAVAEQKRNCDDNFQWHTAYIGKLHAPRRLVSGEYACQTKLYSPYNWSAFNSYVSNSKNLIMILCGIYERACWCKLCTYFNFLGGKEQKLRHHLNIVQFSTLNWLPLLVDFVLFFRFFISLFSSPFLYSSL